jgi:HNH endonuclease
MTAGPLRNQLVHRIVAAAMIGRDLKKDEEVHHRDTNRLNPHWSNLIVMGNKDHGWVSAKQAWFMRDRDAKEKAEWDQFMADKATEFQLEVAEARGEGKPWQATKKDGMLESEWESRTTATL